MLRSRHAACSLVWAPSCSPASIAPSSRALPPQSLVGRCLHACLDTFPELWACDHDLRGNGSSGHADMPPARWASTCSFLLLKGNAASLTELK